MQFVRYIEICISLNIIIIIYIIYIKRGYPESVIEKEMQKVHFSKQGQKSKKVEKGVPFVVTYHPLLNKLSSILHRNLYLLYMNQEVKNVFTPGPIVS